MSDLLKLNELNVDEPGRVTLSGAPDGMDALALAEIARHSAGGALHIALDASRMDATAQVLGFFAPDIQVITIPAWDCLPYDRVSPNPETASMRLDGLCQLASASVENTGRVVVTTLNASVQRVPTRNIVGSAIYLANVGESIDLDNLLRFLARDGYQRAGTVREPGEFAVRGGIVDIFPPGAELPVRLDLFGDELEGVRTFDPLTQRAIAKTDALKLEPVSEVFLDDESIARFRGGYGSRFGAVAGQTDPLYQAIAAGRRHMGMEHWLPLFHETLETLFDYVPHSVVTLDNLIEDALDKRLETIADYYEARKSGERGGGLTDAAVYRPLPPNELYLEGEEWRARISRRPSFLFSQFRQPESPEVRDLGGKRARDFAPERAHQELNLFDAVRDYIGDLSASGKAVVVAAYSLGTRERLSGLLADHGIEGCQNVDSWSEAGESAPGTVGLSVLAVEQGFETDGLAVVTEQDILGERLFRPAKRTRRAEDFIVEASSLSPGDIVVHVEHGIGRYSDLLTIDVAGAPHDCLLILYDGDDKLYIPVENIEVISRYGSEDSDVNLDRLGGSGWQARRARAKDRIRDIADQLIKIAAARELQKGEILTPPAGLYDEFCAHFPYQETDDQQRAIEDVLRDLAAGRPMDRLVCGDVGFGKTEVALRSAFVSVMSGKQVAIVAPTTLLVRQHYATFRDRFLAWPVKIGRLSRMVGAKETTDTKEGLESGDIDIVIGTHALLGKSIKFKDLGLIIVDEEQHFGVAQKERLKNLRTVAHVLTLTATPIPRTMHLALSGVRELSLIATPPVDRLAIRTLIMPFDPVVVREALMREHYRGGQSFYVCPRISDIADIEAFLRDQVPEVRFGSAHGQMPIRALDDVMHAFYEGSIDVLLCTNIIESGLDIPTANTLIIHRSDMYGLSQLYQLRGRIGRSKVRGYAYLTLPARRIPTEAAEKRLKVMQALEGLGAGFSLASHDLDIRGAGNLLGEEQSGHIREVGLELYQEMLEEAVAAARDTGGDSIAEDKWSPQINIGTSVLIPERYVSDLDVRLGLYRRLARLEDRAEIDAYAAELIDRFGPLPQEVDNLLRIVAIKQFCRHAGVERVEAGPKGATIAFHNDFFANPAGLVEFISGQVGTAKLRPDHRLVYMREWDDADMRLSGVMHLMRNLAEIAGQTPESTISPSMGSDSASRAM